MFQRVYFKSHVFKVSQYPGGDRIYTWRMDAGDRPWIYQPAPPALDVGLCANMRCVAVPVAYQVVISCTRHGMAIVREMRDENLAPTKLQHGILAMVNKLSAGLFHHVVQYAI